MSGMIIVWAGSGVHVSSAAKKVDDENRPKHQTEHLSENGKEIISEVLIKNEKKAG